MVFRFYLNKTFQIHLEALISYSWGISDPLVQAVKLVVLFYLYLLCSCIHF